jgi:hypothetical protein
MRCLLFAATMLASCFRVPEEAIYRATRPSADERCVSALAHVKACDARFPDRAALCDYSADGECAPYINAAQTECLQASTCDAVHAAMDRRDWLCGVPLAKLAGNDAR